MLYTGTRRYRKDEASRQGPLYSRNLSTGRSCRSLQIRQTNVQEGEAGGITQQIGATYFPVDAIKTKTAVLNKVIFFVLEMKRLGYLLGTRTERQSIKFLVCLSLTLLDTSRSRTCGLAEALFATSLFWWLTLWCAASTSQEPYLTVYFSAWIGTANPRISQIAQGPENAVHCSAQQGAPPALVRRIP